MRRWRTALAKGCMRRWRSGMEGWRMVVAVALAAAIPAVVPAAAGAASYSWTGESSTTAAWSAGVNWGGTAPSGSATELSFPRLGRATCYAREPQQACYLSENDLSGLAFESLRIDDGDLYGIWGNRIALGSGGMTASPEAGSTGSAGDFIELPIELTAQQSWSIANHSGGELGENGIALLSELTGAHPLTVNISEGAVVYLAAPAEVGPVTIAGANASVAGVLNGFADLFESQLNWTDGNPVDLSHIFFLANGSTGPLSANSSALAVGSGEYPAGGLNAASITLDANSGVDFNISGPNDTARYDYSQLRSSGAVSLGGAHLSFLVTPPSENATCPDLTPGTQYTLVSTTGGLSGEFANAPEGSEIPIKFAKACTQVSQLMKISYTRGGSSSTQTVIGTVIAGASSATSLSASSTNVTTNQGVTLTATVTATEGTPSGTVEFIDNGAPIFNCASQSVSLSGASYTATCHASFAASSSPELISARFSPNRGVNLNPSTSSTEEVKVGADPTTVSLTASSPAPWADQGVTYSAQLSPQDTGPARPSGTIEFLDGGIPIGSCASQPMSSTGWATCQVAYGSAGTHTITARYPGDADFSGSVSAAQSVTVQQSTTSSALKEVAIPSTPSSVWLASRTLVVKSDGWTAVKIGCEGVEACVGRLLLQVKQAASKGARRSKRARLVTVGEGDFSIGGSTSATVAFPVDRLALGLLKGRHGRLPARLVIVQPTPGGRKVTNVRLTESVAHHKGKQRK